MDKGSSVRKKIIKTIAELCNAHGDVNAKTIDEKQLIPLLIILITIIEYILYFSIVILLSGRCVFTFYKEDGDESLWNYFDIFYVEFYISLIALLFSYLFNIF
jgi:hypothetical protein